MNIKRIINVGKDSSFYPVTKEEISEAEQALNLTFPKELKDFYLEVGYGFIKGSGENVNRVMDPYSVRDFRLRQNDFEFYQDIETYDNYENGKLIFFESDESALISIELCDSERSKIYYYDTVIANSLEEFVKKIQEDDSYFIGKL